MKLKLFKRVPDNGLAMFCGSFQTDEGKIKKLCWAVEPPKPMSRCLYHCGDTFAIDILREQLVAEQQSFGFIILDGRGCSIFRISGNCKEKLFHLEVCLPKKHRKGGQSSGRFGRIRDEKRHCYLAKVAEGCVKSLVSGGEKLNVQSVVLAGNGDLKSELVEELDTRISSRIAKIVDVQYGGENGFNEAIQLCGDLLRELSFYKERSVLTKFFTSLACDDELCCYGLHHTLEALQSSAVHTIIVSQNLQAHCFILLNTLTSQRRIASQIPTADALKTQIPHINGKEEEEEERPAAAHPIEIVEERVDLIDWLTENYKQFGSKIQLISNLTQEGRQFEVGFGGISALLRYKMRFEVEDEDADADDEEVEE